MAWMMRTVARTFAALTVALGLLAGTPAARAVDAALPIFDVHVHYSQAAWSAFPPEAVIRTLQQAGVARAIVSSSPDDGSLTLQRAEPSRFVPMLRPYRGDVGTGNWTEAEGVAAYLAERLQRGTYAGIGEFHLHDEAQAQRPNVQAAVRLAHARGIFVYVHANAGPVRALLDGRPDLKVLWAHAGMSEPADVVDAMLERHPLLMTEVSFRAGDIGRTNGGIDPAWAALMTKHRDRFLIGTDTYTTGRWEQYGDLIAQHRLWLAALPPEVAQAIAWRNAVRLFGDGGRPELKPTGQ